MSTTPTRSPQSYINPDITEQRHSDELMKKEHLDHNNTIFLFETYQQFTKLLSTNRQQQYHFSISRLNLHIRRAFSFYCAGAFSAPSRPLQNLISFLSHLAIDCNNGSNSQILSSDFYFQTFLKAKYSEFQSGVW